MERKHEHHEAGERRAVHHEERRSLLLFYALVGIVGLILILSVVQTVQITALKDNIRTGGASTSVAASPAPQAPVQQPRAAPAMVGGC